MSSLLTYYIDGTDLHRIRNITIACKYECNHSSVQKQSLMSVRVHNHWQVDRVVHKINL